MILFLDDCQVRTQLFLEKYPTAVTTSRADKMIDLLDSTEHVRYLFLDHDLEGDVEGYVERENTGMDVVRWLEQNKRAIDQVIVHSMNVVASPLMRDRLVQAGYYVVACPFFSLLPQLGQP